MTTTAVRPRRSRAREARTAGPSRTRPRLVRAGANLVGAAGAALFARAGVEHFLATRSAVGAGFVAAELWVVVAYLVRRPAAAVTTRAGDWLLAFGGTFGGVLLRPTGLHDAVGVRVGSVLQAVGIVAAIAAFGALGRSFGFVAADRGLRVRGPYRVVRHPLYAAYVLLLLGYLAQSLSWANALVVALVIGCDAGRSLAEERVLATTTSYDDYAAVVRWRMVPGVW